MKKLTIDDIQEMNQTQILIQKKQRWCLFPGQVLISPDPTQAGKYLIETWEDVEDFREMFESGGLVMDLMQPGTMGALQEQARLLWADTDITIMYSRSIAAFVCSSDNIYRYNHDEPVESYLCKQDALLNAILLAPEKLISRADLEKAMKAYFKDL